MSNAQQLATLVSRTYFKDEASFLDILYRDIHSIIERLEKSSDKYYSDDEDKITSAIVLTLCELGYDASEQTKKNGTVDITVKPKDNDFSWIGEAKIGYGNTKIFEGMLQLLSRYVKRDENAGLLIYYQKHSSHKHFNKWLKYLYFKEWEKYCTNKGILTKANRIFGHLESKDYKSTKEYYHDLNVVKPCGKPAVVRMFYADLHHDPIDKSGVNNQSLILGQAKNELRDYCQRWDDGQTTTEELEELVKNLKLHVGFDPDGHIDLSDEEEEDQH